jgi:hypothetical protein
MAEPIEVAIQKALVDRLLAFTASPAIAVALPEVEFTQPANVPGAFWLKANFLPAPTLAIAVQFDAGNQYQGIFQVSVFHARGQGEYKAARIASDVIVWFGRGTAVTQDGFTALIWKPPYRSPMLPNGAWAMIAVTIPYIAFGHEVPGPPTGNLVLSPDDLSASVWETWGMDAGLAATPAVPPELIGAPDDLADPAWATWALIPGSGG